GTAAVVGPSHPHMTTSHFLVKRTEFDGWNKYNQDYWHSNYPDFAEHFIENIFSEPHSTKQIEDGVGWANDTTGPVMASTVNARSILPPFDVGEAMYRKIKCPVLMIHGDDDRIQPYARGQLVAELTGAEFVTIEGGGHNPLARIPAKCNTLISEFLDRRLGLAARPKPIPLRQRTRLVLYLASPT